ncbi:hypothetical protein CLOP_g20661 [Closterium sp. NIES-67]|nr:hypothetical protein CLOP_g20661 [Closterium sp. NIES-67]
MQEALRRQGRGEMGSMGGHHKQQRPAWVGNPGRQLWWEQLQLADGQVKGELNQQQAEEQQEEGGKEEDQEKEGEEQGGGKRGGRKGRGVVGQLLGQGMAATAVRVDRRTRRAIEDPLLGEAYEVVLYFGIIDILQEYDVTKKVEHLYKSLQYDGHSISAVNPSLYARRFRSFIYATFPDPLTPHKPAPNVLTMMLMVTVPMMAMVLVVMVLLMG